jgi:hypothetical protein
MLETPKDEGHTYHRVQGISLALSMSVARPMPLSSSSGYRHKPGSSNSSAQHRLEAVIGREKEALSHLSSIDIRSHTQGCAKKATHEQASCYTTK